MRRSRTEDAATKDRTLLRSVRFAPIFACRAIQASSSAWNALEMLAPPPFFVVFPSEERLLLAASQSLSPAEINALRTLIAARLPPVTSVQSLALLFGLSPSLIGAMVRNPGRYYRRFEIRSRHRSREIHTPKVALKVIQRWFGYHLSHSVSLDEHVHGFVPHRSTVTAARIHCPATWVLSLDVRNFFGSVTPERVFDSLIELGYGRQAAHLLTSLCTLVMDGGSHGLPQGAPSSPVLANLAFRDTDLKLKLFAAGNSLRITRYADDISLSGDGHADTQLQHVVAQLIETDGWVIAQNKTRLVQVPTQKPEVLGLLVDLANPRLPKRYRNRVRMMQHMLKTQYLSDAKRAQYMGHVAYAESIL